MTDANKRRATGSLYVVGVGPGDPELITVKGSRILREVPVIFVPQKDESSRSYAREIIGSLVGKPGPRVVGLVFPMVRDTEKLTVHWENAVETMWQHLRDGQDCALVNEGDPFLFGTAIHALDALGKSHPEVEITVIPGVSSVTASAARAALPLAVNDEKVAILSGHCDDDYVRDTLQKFDTVVFLKVSSVFGRLLTILEEMRLTERCVYVSKCSTDEERIVRDISELKGQRLEYFSLLIVKK